MHHNSTSLHYGWILLLPSDSCDGGLRMSSVGPGSIATRQAAPQPLVLSNDRQPTGEGRSGGVRETIE